MGKMQRQKGARGEREVADMLRPLYPKARRRCSGEESQSDIGKDIDNTGDLIVQVNISKQPPFLKKLEEAIGASKEGETPVAFLKKTRSKKGRDGEYNGWVVLLRAEDYLELLKDYEDAYERAIVAEGHQNDINSL